MKQELEQALQGVVQDVLGLDQPVELTRPEEKFGDYATSVALQLAKQLARPPREVAELLAAKLPDALQGRVREVTIAGPGFINLRLSDTALSDSLTITPLSQQYAGRTVVIETNNPNPFKAMHIGHAFNAILGDTIANLLEAGHAEVHRVGYHGDVGSHVGKSMWALLAYVDGDIQKLFAIPTDERNTFMSTMYAAGAKAYKEDDSVKQEIDHLAEQSFTLQDPLYRQVYETCKQWSFEQLDATIQRLGCVPTEKKYLESEADAIGVETVQAHVGTVFKESDGAIIFEGEQYGSFDNVFVSSRGRGLYAARDLGLMQLKQKDYHPNKSYIVTAEEQRAYFVGVIKAAEMCLPELNGVTINISTGTVLLSSGKMSSREGKVLDIAWLFEQIENAVRARGAEPTYDTILGSLRYQFLKVRIGSDVVFDINEAVSITGNSGPYLQYAHARARSILTKATSERQSHESDFEVGERSLVRKLTEYPEAVDKAVNELKPHHVASYLYELAQAFNFFYEHNRVIGHKREAIRLSLVAQYASTLKTGLHLLGITAPESM